MFLAFAILAATLSRAEIVERFRAAPVTMCDGLVQVWADCPSDMRRAYQTPVAGFLADTCRSLYQTARLQPSRFERPGILAYIGDGVTNDARVVTRVTKRADGTRCLKVWIPAPGYADLRALKVAAARGWTLAVKGTNIGETAAWDALVDADPEMRVAAELADLVAWRTQGVYARGRDDEDYLRLQRKILRPGTCSREEALTFASRLILYPSYDDCRFCGKYDALEFRDAIRLAKDDLMARIAALKKADQLVVWGGGRGEKLEAAAFAYSDFLRAFARGDTDADALGKLLDDADDKMKETLQ